MQRVLVHGDADTEVPFQQSVAMEAALRAVNVPTKLVRLPGGGHGATFPIDGRPNGKPHPELSNAIDEMVRWLNQYLKVIDLITNSFAPAGHGE